MHPRNLDARWRPRTLGPNPTRILRKSGTQKGSSIDIRSIASKSISDHLPKRIDHRISPTAFDFGDDDNDFLLEPSSRGNRKSSSEVQDSAPRPAELYKSPTRWPIACPISPPPAPPSLKRSIRPQSAHSALRSNAWSTLEYEDSNVSEPRCLKGKGFAIGPSSSATGSGASRESRQPDRKPPDPEPSHNPSTVSPLLSLPHWPLPLHAATIPARKRSMKSGASDMGPSPTSPPPAVGRSMSKDSNGSFVNLPSIPGPSGPPGAFAVSSSPHACSFDVRTASPILIPPTSPVTGRAISPSPTLSSNYSTNATLVGFGAPTANAIILGYNSHGEAPVQKFATTGRRGRDTDGDDDEVNGDDPATQQGDPRTSLVAPWLSTPAFHETPTLRALVDARNEPKPSAVYSYCRSIPQRLFARRALHFLLFSIRNHLPVHEGSSTVGTPLTNHKRGWMDRLSSSGYCVLRRARGGGR
ncbi:unnamed protein product [Rhizoctonia solani]|uniref:Uncharacterized protein n=1 Tax=Rhizoctonia solani TaxID=456999 RepID=A0A8H3DUJ3_9AGAM|nr:unnamed protein product [Rhizoctonia solani]